MLINAFGCLSLRCLVAAFAVVALTCATPQTSTAQPRSSSKKSDKPDVKPLDLVTSDGVNLRAFYFPSDKGIEAVPVMIVHEWQGQASPYAPLVLQLWKAGCAVIVPELRGHGNSKTQQTPGGTRELELSRMRRADVMAMINNDLERVKKFIIQENNQRRLNANALVVIGIREGAVIAAHWAVRDLNFPSIGRVKQGQDVKALVLVSPERTVEGISLDDTMKDRLLPMLPFLVMVGESSRQVNDTDRFIKRLESSKKRLGRGEVRGLYYDVIPTALDGHRLVNDIANVIPRISRFVENQVISNAARFQWVERPE